METFFAERKPYVLDSPTGSQIRSGKKSRKQITRANLTIHEFVLGRQPTEMKAPN